jgi:hypothetical protein
MVGNISAIVWVSFSVFCNDSLHKLTLAKIGDCALFVIPQTMNPLANGEVKNLVWV